MRIVLVLDRFDPLAGGLEQWTHRFARHLLESGHEVHVVAFAEANNDLPVSLHLVEPARLMQARGRRIARVIAGLAADVVHDSGTSWSGTVFHPQTGSRLLSLDREIASFPRHRRARAAISPRLQWRRLEMARLERLQAARARRIIAVSRRIRTMPARRHGVAEEGIVLIPNGVDTRRFTPDNAPWLRGPTRRRLGVGDDAVLFLATAHNFRLKGVDTTLRALARLARGGRDVRLAVAGGTPDPFWHGLVQQLGLGGRVDFRGLVGDMESLYAASDAVLHPTRWDACSLATIEAMASGLPVVTSAMDGAGDLIADGRNGFVLRDPDDVDALAARMASLLDPGERRRVGAAARIAALGHDIVDNCRAVEAVLAAAAGR
jgi:UDP-glucose:(heptosyl)LPS alpha-1,3-glucosyltransferase